MNNKDTEHIFQESTGTALKRNTTDIHNKATVPFRVDNLLQENKKKNVERDTFKNTTISLIDLKEVTKLLATLLKSLSKIGILLVKLWTWNVLYFIGHYYATHHIFTVLFACLLEYEEVIYVLKELPGSGQ